MNSFYGGGKQGVSDCFGSALWCLDYMFNVASHGGAGVNMETDINQLGFISFYSPIVHDAAGVCSARPEYYAMLAFALAGRGELLKASIDRGDINLTAYATGDEGGAIWLILINKDLTLNANVDCPLPRGFEGAMTYRLRADSPEAKANVTFAASAVAEDGSWRPTPGEPVCVTERIAQVPLPHASAVALRFKRQ